MISTRLGTVTTSEAYDVVVLGAGPAGENAADYALRNSDRTALLIERHLVGGECSYYACMPSKALLRPLDVRTAAENLGGLPDSVPLSVPALLARRDEWVSSYDDAGQVRWAADAGIEVARGVGRLCGERQVQVRGEDSVREITARHAVVVATGSTPVMPEGFAELHPWTSRDATGVQEVPSSIAVVGGGVVAAEAALWLAGLGAQVTMLVRGDRLLSRFEAFAGELVTAGLQRAGVEVRFGAEAFPLGREHPMPTGLGRVHGGAVRVAVAGEELTYAELLVATGRRPALADVGLESIGLDPKGIVDPGRRPDWLYVVGDASGEAPLTHWGKYAARLTGDRIAAKADGRPAPQPPADVPVPQVVFTDPQVASVGLTEDAAVRDGWEVETAEVDLANAAGFGLLRDDAAGRAKLVLDATSGRVVGATFVGTEVAELLHAATVAIVGRLTVDQLWHAVPAYPTASEIWLRLLDGHRSH